MKGVVLAAGKGSRLAELNLQHKSFAEVNGKRVIEYSLELLSQEHHGSPLCSEIIIVVGYHADAIREYVGKEYRGVPVKYVYQHERKGVAQAVKTAGAELNDDFIMCLADEILLNERIGAMVDAFYAHNAQCMCGVVIDGTDFSMKPIAYQVNEKRLVTGVREKPDAYENEYRGIGECVFAESCLRYLDVLKPNPIRGEYEMGDWIRMIAEDGKRVEDLTWQTNTVTSTVPKTLLMLSVSSERIPDKTPLNKGRLVS